MNFKPNNKLDWSHGNLLSVLDEMSMVELRAVFPDAVKKGCYREPQKDYNGVELWFQSEEDPNLIFYIYTYGTVVRIGGWNTSEEELQAFENWIRSKLNR